MRYLFFVGAVFFAVATGFVSGANAGDFAFVYVEHEPARLPPCPQGCEVRIYHVAPRGIGDPKRKSSWHRFLFNAGMYFPEGGFVVYQRSTTAVLIASTADDLDLIAPLR